MFYRPAPHFVAESIQQFGPNVVGFQMETGERRWYIVGCYLAPDSTLTLESAVAALKERPRGIKLLVAGDFNINLLDPEGDRRGEDIVVAMVRGVLKDMAAHFLPRRHSWCRDGRICSMVR